MGYLRGQCLLRLTVLTRKPLRLLCYGLYRQDETAVEIHPVKDEYHKYRCHCRCRNVTDIVTSCSIERLHLSLHAQYSRHMLSVLYRDQLGYMRAGLNKSGITHDSCLIQSVLVYIAVYLTVFLVCRVLNKPYLIWLKAAVAVYRVIYKGYLLVIITWNDNINKGRILAVAQLLHACAGDLVFLARSALFKVSRKL